MTFQQITLDQLADGVILSRSFFDGAPNDGVELQRGGTRLHVASDGYLSIYIDRSESLKEGDLGDLRAVILAASDLDTLRRRALLPPAEMAALAEWRKLDGFLARVDVGGWGRWLEMTPGARTFALPLLDALRKAYLAAKYRDKDAVQAAVSVMQEHLPPDVVPTDDMITAIELLEDMCEAIVGPIDGAARLAA